MQVKYIFSSDNTFLLYFWQDIWFYYLIIHERLSYRNHFLHLVWFVIVKYLDMWWQIDEFKICLLGEGKDEISVVPILIDHFIPTNADNTAIITGYNQFGLAENSSNGRRLLHFLSLSQSVAIQSHDA